jgi:hypothetical protein
VLKYYTYNMCIRLFFADLRLIFLVNVNITICDPHKSFAFVYILVRDVYLELRIGVYKSTMSIIARQGAQLFTQYSHCRENQQGYMKLRHDAGTSNLRISRN